MGLIWDRRSGRAGLLEIGGHLLRTRLRWHHPVYLIHALTARCNGSCQFCAWRFYEPHDELTTEEVKGLYREARASGFFAVSFWGGEPLLRPDAGDLFRHAREVGLRTHLVTNGALLERKLELVLSFVDRICVSVDHPSERHDEMRGIDGLYQTILRATRRLRQRDPRKKVLFVYTLRRDNADPATIERMAGVMRSLGVIGVFNALRLEAATSDPAESEALSRFEPEPEARAAAFATVERLKRQGFPILNSYRYIEKLRHGPPVYRCHWPKFILPVEANGDVVDCMHWGRRPVGNIRNTPFSELLRHPRLRALAGREGEACHKCVSIHRVEISEVWDGRLEPLISWALTV